MTKRKEHRVSFVRDVERSPSARVDAPAPAYPSFARVLESSEIGAIVRRALAIAAAAGLATAAAGCSPPECQATRLGEVKSHGSSALDDVADLRGRQALDELGVAFGIIPHTSMPLAGAAPVVITPPVVPSPTPLPTPDDPTPVVNLPGADLPDPSLAGDS